jgi:hypothetical protein
MTSHPKTPKRIPRELACAALLAAAGLFAGCGEAENKVILPENPTPPPTAEERRQYLDSGGGGGTQAPNSSQQKQR